MNVYTESKPWQSNAERLVSEALAASQAPQSVILQIRPPLPQIVPFPPRFGYPTVTQRAFGIRQVVGVEHIYGDARNEISGGPASYSGASRNILGAASTGF